MPSQCNSKFGPINSSFSSSLHLQQLKYTTPFKNGAIKHAFIGLVAHTESMSLAVSQNKYEFSVEIDGRASIGFFLNNVKFYYTSMQKPCLSTLTSPPVFMTP